MVGAISESMFHKGFRLTHRPLPTYPTENAVPASGLERHGTVRTAWQMDSGQIPRICLVRSKGDAPGVSRARSEEHTSELQSQSNLVCRLLLANNKTIKVVRHDR